MSKTSKVAITFLSAIALALGVLYWAVTREETFISSWSPDNRFKVELSSGALGMYPLADTEVSFQVFTDRVPFIGKTSLVYYPGTRLGFQENFSEIDWQQGNSLILKRHPMSAANPETDLLVVTNLSRRLAKYVRVSSADLVLFLGLQPQETRSIPVSKQAWLTSIDAEVMFDDGAKQRTVANFLHRDEMNHKSLRMCISVEESGVKVESAEIEGFGSGLIIPAAMSCAENQVGTRKVVAQFKGLGD